MVAIEQVRRRHTLMGQGWVVVTLVAVFILAVLAKRRGLSNVDNVSSALVQQCQHGALVGRALAFTKWCIEIGYLMLVAAADAIFEAREVVE